MRKICVVSGSRSDYCLLKPVILKLDQSKKISLKVVLTGAHLITGEAMITGKAVTVKAICFSRSIDFI